MENQLLELIKTRRSCRHYKAEQVSDKELNAVLEAGEYAPTGHGLQDPIIVRTDKDSPLMPPLQGRAGKRQRIKRCA